MPRYQNWPLFSALQIFYFSPLSLSLSLATWPLISCLWSRSPSYYVYKTYRAEYGTRFMQLSSALCYSLCFRSEFLFFIFISDTVIYFLNLGGLPHWYCRWNYCLLYFRVEAHEFSSINYSLNLTGSGRYLECRFYFQHFFPQIFEMFRILKGLLIIYVLVFNCTDECT